ncbi:unnamed protein product, partial [Menidia menidia]
MAGLWKSYQVLMTKYPWTVQIVTAGKKNHSRRADSGVSGRSRSQKLTALLSLSFFSLKTKGPVIGSWYKVLDKLVVGGTKSAAMKKMLVDQLAFAPCFLGAFLCISGALNGLTVDDNVAKLKRLWPPVQIANFYFVPLHH